MNDKFSLVAPKIGSLLERLHSHADSNDDRIMAQIRDSGVDRSSMNAQEQAVLLRDASLPVSKEVGRFLYAVVRSIAAKRIVEFGTSFGISTIYLAAAVRDGGGGVVIGSELEESKISKARQHIYEAGLSDYVDIRQGDAMQTLMRDDGVIDLLFLDGWKEAYLDLLKVLSGRLRQGSVVLADDLDIAPDKLKSYLEYVRNPLNGFVSAMLPLGDGMEYSVRL